MRNRYLLIADLWGIAVAALAAFVLRFDLRFFAVRDEAEVFLVAALLLKPGVFWIAGLYHRYWRYATLQDLKAVAIAAFGAVVVMGAFVGLALALGVMPAFSRGVLILDGMLTFIVIGGIRVSVRVLAESRAARAAPTRTAANRRVVVVGAGNAGTLVVREMQRNPQLGMEPIGFLDDDPGKRGKSIVGVPVIGDTRSLDRVTSADVVIIAMPTAAGAAVRSVVDQCQSLRLPFQTMPGLFELLDGQVSVSRLRNVEIADLLRRRQITGRADLTDYVRGRSVLVTGAGGSIGFELCRQVCLLAPRRLVMLGHGENSLFEARNRLREAIPDADADLVVADIRDRTRMARILTGTKPDIVFHAAACKHVPLMEDNFEEAVTSNISGTLNLLDAALDAGVERFVAISTDKAVSPRGIMGASKRMADLLVRDAAERSGRAYAAVRFGNVLGTRGSVVPFFQRQIARGGPVTITDSEMKRFFMTIAEAAHLVLQAGGLGSSGGLFVLEMGEPVRIADLARDLIRLSGFTADQIPIVVTGSRPGEKLEEALWERDAVVERTDHPDILRVTEPAARVGDLRAAVASLELAARGGDRLAVNAILTDWIPTFDPGPDTGGRSGIRPGATRPAHHHTRPE
jgi:FlaA1/EpsC-like NDP-sugar epimerase